MKIKSTQEFRTWFKNLSKGRQNEWYDENFIGHSYEDHTGFFGMYHGEKKDIYGFLRKEVEMAEDGQAIYEFVQNAADSDSSQFYMFYNEKYFLAINNGQVFSKEGIKSILNIGQSHGKTDPNKIGRFGIGFKLVHRLVGKTSGLDELLNKDGSGYRGPTLFSWSEKKQFEDFLTATSFEEYDFKKNNSPWLLKILLTNFPAFPDEEILDIDYKTNIPFPSSEVNEFQTFLNSLIKKIDVNSMHQGTIFFIKLGEDKYKYLEKQKEEYRDGLSTSMHFLKSLSLIKINDYEIHKDKSATNIKTFTVENGSDEFNEIGLTEERDKSSDIQFQLCYASDIDSAKTIKSHPNIYKYFPAVKEVNNLAFIIHSNIFELTSNRQNLTETSINKGLLQLLSKKIIDEMNLCKKSSVNDYYKLYESIIFSDQSNNNAGSGWQKECFYEILYQFAKNNTPTKEERFLSSEKVIIKGTKLNVKPSMLGVDKEWLYRSADEYKKLIRVIKEKFNIQKWGVEKIIENGCPEKINEWIYKLDDDEYSILLKEINKSIPYKNLESIKFIKANNGKYYSLRNIINKNQLIIFEKINNIKDTLYSIGFSYSIFNIDDYPKIKTYISKRINYLDEKNESLLFEIITSKELWRLPSHKKRDLFTALSNLHGVGSTKLSKIELFCNLNNDVHPLDKLINSKINNIPDWLNEYKITDSENIFIEIRKPEYLCGDEKIYENIIYPSWDKIIENQFFSNEKINHFYETVKYYYDESKNIVETLSDSLNNSNHLASLSDTNKKYIFSGKEFYTTENIYYSNKLEKIDNGFKNISNAIEKITKLVVPPKNSLPYLSSSPFETKKTELQDHINDGFILIEEVEILLQYFNSIHFNIFYYGYFTNINNKLEYKCDQEIKQYYSENTKLNNFIEENLPSKFHKLPNEISIIQCENNILMGDNLNKAISSETDIDFEEHIEILIDILDEGNFNEIIDNIDKIIFKQRDFYTKEDFEFKLIKTIKNDKIKSIINKITISTNESEFKVDQALFSNKVEFENGKYVINLSEILPNSEEFNNGKIISDIGNELIKAGVNQEKIKNIFNIDNKLSAEKIKNVLNEIIKTYPVIKNGSQLSFILLYNNFIKNIELSKINAVHINNEKYDVNYPLYLKRFSFISEQETLHKNYECSLKNLKLNKKNPFFKAKNSNCEILFQPFFDEEEENFCCPSIKDDLDQNECMDLLSYIFDYWTISKNNKMTIKSIDWDNISEKNTNEVLGFTPKELIWKNEYAIESEKCPEWIKDWTDESDEKINFLNDFGINIEGSDIQKLRCSLISDYTGELFSENKVNNIDNTLLKNTFEWIEENEIIFSCQEKFSLVTEVANCIDIEFDRFIDEDKLISNSIEYHEEFNADYYHDWRSDFDCCIYFYDSEIPYNIEYNGYILIKIEEENIAQIGDSIYLNRKHFKAEFDLTKIDVLSDDARMKLFEYIIGNISNSKNEVKKLKQENILLKTDFDFFTGGDNVTPYYDEPSKNNRKQINREYKDRVKLFLIENKFDVSNWSENHAHIRGVIDPNSNEVEILVKGAKRGKLYISPVEWLVLLKENSKLIIINSSNKIINISFNKMIKSANLFNLQFQTDNINNKFIHEFANFFQYVRDCKFIIEGQYLDHMDLIDNFCLFEKQKNKKNIDDIDPVILELIESFGELNKSKKTIIGTVKFFDESKGYGFIGQKIGSNVFAHVSKIVGAEKCLVKGQRVEFTITEAQKGPQAENIVVLENVNN